MKRIMIVLFVISLSVNVFSQGKYRDAVMKTWNEQLKSRVLKNADSTSFRTFSDIKYLKNADSTSFRTFSDIKYLKNADSTSFRTWSNLIYLKNADSTSFRTFSNLKYIEFTDEVMVRDSFLTTATVDTVVVSGVTTSSNATISQWNPAWSSAMDTSFYAVSWGTDTVTVTRAAQASGGVKSGAQFILRIRK